MSADFGSKTSILRYYFYLGTTSQGFVAPILIEFILSRGISLTDVGVLSALFMASWTFSEIPTGYIADRLGRRVGLLLGNICGSVALVGFSLSTSFYEFAVVYFVWAFGIAFRSGTADAWLYDLLVEQHDSREFSRIRGRGGAVLLSVTAVTSILGSHLAAIQWWYPFAANAVLFGVGILALFTFPTVNHQSGIDVDPLTPLAAITVIREKFSRTDLSLFIFYTALILGFTDVVRAFTQPVSTNLGVSIASLGWLYAGLNLSAAFASYLTGRIKSRVGIRIWFFIAPISISILFASTVLIPVLALPLFLTTRMFTTVSEPLRNHYLNDRILSANRATVLSAAEMSVSFIAIFLQVAGGVLADIVGPGTMLGILGGGVTLCLIVLQASGQLVYYSDEQNS